MKKKSRTELRWILFNVVLIIIPVVVVAIASGVKTEGIPQISDLLGNSMLAVVSVYCGLCSLCWDMWNQEINEKSKQRALILFVVSLLVVFLVWTCYLFSLSGCLDIIAIWVFVVVVILIL